MAGSLAAPIRFAIRARFVLASRGPSTMIAFAPLRETFAVTSRYSASLTGRAQSSLVFIRQFSHLAGADHADPCYKYLLSHRHVFPFASILARISDFSTLPTLERGRSSQTSICLGVLTLPTRCFTKADTAATSTVRPALGCTTATTRSPHFSSGKPMTAQS